MIKNTSILFFFSFPTLLKISAGILGASKVIFFDKINALLGLMDPRYFQICYLDTGK